LGVLDGSESSLVVRLEITIPQWAVEEVYQGNFGDFALLN